MLTKFEMNYKEIIKHKSTTSNHIKTPQHYHQQFLFALLNLSAKARQAGDTKSNGVDYFKGYVVLIITGILQI
ncbi:MAG: hypothetical protein J7K39_07665 [Bacteroidales bacterium]|nr:hypothetical protein [Bacteroidales bacterium]